MKNKTNKSLTLRIWNIIQRERERESPTTPITKSLGAMRRVHPKQFYMENYFGNAT